MSGCIFLPACAGACVLVLVVLLLAIEKKKKTQGSPQECLGDCHQNRRNKK
jgi:hypothetical protein